MPPPPLREELWEEILLRLPPDDPATLARASLVCTAWHRIVSRRGFLRRLGELHRVAPVLGLFLDFLFNNTDMRCFVATAASAFSLPSLFGRSSFRQFLDCRHGRALLLVPFRTGDGLLVWEPITGYKRCVPLPASLAQNGDRFKAAVICAADGCDHWSCHGGPFRVVAASYDIDDDDDHSTVASAREYSSETGAWGEQISTSRRCRSSGDCWNFMIYLKAPTLMGNSVYFQYSDWQILKYDFGGQGLMLINAPAVDASGSARYDWSIQLMKADDGKLEVAGIENESSCDLHLWSGETTSRGGVGWVHKRIIHLHNVLPASALPGNQSGMMVGISLIGFAEGQNIIFMETQDGIFTFELKTGRARKVCRTGDIYTLFPFISFYAPVACDAAGFGEGTAEGADSKTEDSGAATKRVGGNTQAPSWSPHGAADSRLREGDAPADPAPPPPSSLQPSSSIGSSSSGNAWPPGRKQSKGKGTSSSTCSPMVETEMKSMFDKKAAMMESMVRSDDEFKKIQLQFLELEKIKEERKKNKEEERIMLMDMSTLTAVQLAYWEDRQKEILEKCRKRSAK